MSHPVQGVTQRTIETMLREMRKRDRDRDRVLHPNQIEDLIEKYKIGIQGVLPQLQKRFASNSKFHGMTDYEDMITYFLKLKGDQKKIQPVQNTSNTTGEHSSTIPCKKGPK